MGISMIRLSDFAFKIDCLVRLSFGLALLAFVVLSAINLISSNLYPTFHGAVDRQMIFLIAHITYIVGVLVSPIMLAFLGCKMTLIIGAFGVTVTLVTLIWPTVIIVYTSSVAMGFSVAFIITGAYTFIAKFTKTSNVSRNAAIIFTAIETSQLVSNCLVYFTLELAKMRNFAYVTTGVLMMCGATGIILTIVTKYSETKEENITSGCKRIHAEWTKFVSITTKSDLLLFLPMFFYTGSLLALLQGNYGTWPTFTLDIMKYGIDFGTMSSLTVLTSTVVCGIVLVIAGREIEPLGRALTATLGFIFQTVASFFLIGVVPKDGSYTSAYMTEEMSNSTITMIILMDVLLGFGVALIMTQIYAKLLEQYPSAPGIAITIFKTTQAIGVFTALYYSTLLTLPYQSTICMLVGLIAVFAFIFMERTAVEELNCEDDPM